MRSTIRVVILSLFAMLFSTIISCNNRHRSSTLSSEEIESFIGEELLYSGEIEESLLEESIDLFSHLKYGMDFMKSSNPTRAWEEWDYCLTEVDSRSELTPFIYLGMAISMGEIDSRSSLILAKRALQLAQRSEERDEHLIYSSLNAIVYLLVVQAEPDDIGQDIDYQTKYYSHIADSILSSPTCNVDEESCSKSIYRLATESLLWLGEDSLASTYISKFRGNILCYRDSNLTDAYTDILYGISDYISGDYEAASQRLLSSIDIIGDKTSFLNPDLELPYAYLGYLYYDIGDYKNAIINIERSIKVLLKDNYRDVDDLLEFYPYEEIKSKSNTYNIILCFIKLQEFHIQALDANNRERSLTDIVEISDYTDGLIKSWFLQAADEETLLFATKLIKDNNAITIDAIYRHSPMRREETEQIYSLATEPTSFYLNYMKEMNLLEQSKDIDSDRVKELNRLTLELNRGSKKEMVEYSSKHIERQLSLLKVKSHLYKWHKDALKKKIKRSNLPSISDEETGILKYFIHDTLLYTIYHTQNHSGVKCTPFSNYRAQIEELLRDIKSGESDSHQQIDLYSKFIEPIKKELKGVKRLHIFMDEELSQIPFELLRMDGGKMLVEQFSITYNSSPKSIDKSSNQRRSPTLAIAPIFEEERDKNRELNLAPLLYSKEELDEIALDYRDHGLEITLLTGNKATKEQFKREVEGKRVIHIATHGVAGKEHDEGLFFTPVDGDKENDGFLRLSELYSLNIDADLVVLSACQTALGEVAEGEGILALPRGFIYGGASHVIASLWKIHDKRAKFLMTRLYHHLLDSDCSYAEALQQAKIECIEEGYLPLDWSGFILISE